MYIRVYVEKRIGMKGGNTVQKRKIALIAATRDAEILKAMIDGMKERLTGIITDIHVFWAFPSFGLDAPENFANYNIFSLAKYEEYDGFLFAINVYQGYDMIKTYHPSLLSCGKPMVSLEYEMEGVPTIVPDGYSAEYRLVEHLIKEHGCRKINYVGGSADHPDNVLRKKAYTDALKANGIEIEDCRIRDYSFIDDDGRKAYADFKELGIETPDAVVCANDAMALGYCQAAETDGLYPPDDFLVVGYDNDENSRVFTPMITTIDKDYHAMGYLGCDVLLRQINGEKVDTVIAHEQEIVLRGSCGCYAPEELISMDIRELRRQIYFNVNEESSYYEKLNQVRQNLALSDSEGLYNYYMLEVLRRFDMYGYCMCINQSVYYGTQAAEVKWEIGFDEEQYVLSGMKHGVSQDEAMIIQSKDYVPEYLQQNDDETHVYMFTPLQRYGAALGYFVLIDADSMMIRKLIITVVNGIASSYSNLRNFENLQKMNKRLDSVYVKDALTDMYNRFGYMRDGYEMFAKSKAYGKPLMVMFMDMDRLKEINDIYGHSHGDNALVMFSEVLKTCAGEDKIAVRYGGDEFLIIGPVENEAGAEAFKRILEEELERKNNTSGLPYQIEASIGYVLTDVKGKKELDEYVEEADALMYEVKKRNRKNRQN